MKAYHHLLGPGGVQLEVSKFSTRLLYSPPVHRWYSPQWQCHQRTPACDMTTSCTSEVRSVNGEQDGSTVPCWAGHGLRGVVSLSNILWSPGKVVYNPGPKLCVHLHITHLNSKQGLNGVSKYWKNRCTWSSQDPSLWDGECIERHCQYQSFTSWQSAGNPVHTWDLKRWICHSKVFIIWEFNATGLKIIELLRVAFLKGLQWGFPEVSDPP